MNADYTAHLEARAAWYAAVTLDLEDQLNVAQTLAEELRAEARLERLEAQVDAEGLGGLVEDARDVLTGDAERVAEILADGKPERPR
jgi:hypothetical protein